jgi:GTP cyclohydrolase II
VVPTAETTGADVREYDIATQVLRDLGLESVRLLTGNAHKVEALEELGVKVTGQEPLAAAATRAPLLSVANGNGNGAGVPLATR